MPTVKFLKTNYDSDNLLVLCNISFAIRNADVTSRYRRPPSNGGEYFYRFGNKTLLGSKEVFYNR